MWAENRETLISLLCDSLRVKAEEMLAEEVNALCSESHRPETGAQYRRGGSESGTCYAAGRREPILRLRVRKQVGNGTEPEHVLASYAPMRRPGNNAAAVVTVLGAGMSTRSQAWVSEDVMSKSASPATGLRRGPPISPTCASETCARRRLSGSSLTGCASAVARW